MKEKIDRNLKWVLLAKGGVGIREVAKRYKVHFTTVQKVLVRYHIGRKFVRGRKKSTNVPQKDKNGYMKITVNGKSKFYHRMLMEQFLGRKLRKTQHVHHKNGIRDDNRLENLEVVSYRKHRPEKTKLIWSLQARIRELEGKKLSTGR